MMSQCDGGDVATLGTSRTQTRSPAVCDGGDAGDAHFYPFIRDTKCGDPTRSPGIIIYFHLPCLQRTITSVTGVTISARRRPPVDQSVTAHWPGHHCRRHVERPRSGLWTPEAIAISTSLTTESDRGTPPLKSIWDPVVTALVTGTSTGKRLPPAVTLNALKVLVTVLVTITNFDNKSKLIKRQLLQIIVPVPQQ